MATEITAAGLEANLHRQIPMSGFMGIRVTEASSEGVTLEAPLDLNHNHLGTAFGGSLAAIATLAGYCCLWVALGDPGIHVVVRRSELNYKRPVRGQIEAKCRMPKGWPDAAFHKALATRGKARMALEVTISENERECLTFLGEFVALK